MITDWTLLALAFVAVWAAVSIVYGLWSARDVRHEPAAPEVPAPHGHH